MSWQTNIPDIILTGGVTVAGPDPLHLQTRFFKVWHQSSSSQRYFSPFQDPCVLFLPVLSSSLLLLIACLYILSSNHSLLLPPRRLVLVVFPAFQSFTLSFALYLHLSVFSHPFLLALMFLSSLHLSWFPSPSFVSPLSSPPRLSCYFRKEMEREKKKMLVVHVPLYVPAVFTESVSSDKLFSDPCSCFLQPKTAARCFPTRALYFTGKCKKNV